MRKKINRKRIRTIVPYVLLLAVLPLVSHAQPPFLNPVPQSVPELINYQGLLFLEDGSTDVTGTYDIKFFLYYETRLGTPLWGEVHNGVQVSRGGFSVLLGAGTALNGIPHGAITEVLRDEAVYVEMRVDGDTPIRIRQRFTSTPHALAAQHAITAVHGVPAGTVMPFAGGGNVPYGWIACQGQLLSQADYPDLFAAIGTTWGGDAINFNLPHFGGRIPVGVDGGHPLSTRRGAENHTLTVAEMPSHRHGYQDKEWRSTLGVTGVDTQVRDNSDADSTRTTGSSGLDFAHNNIQPSAIVQYIIKW